MWVPTEVQLADGLTEPLSFKKKVRKSGSGNNLPAVREKFRDVSVAQMDLEQKDWWQ